MFEKYVFKRLICIEDYRNNGNTTEKVERKQVRVCFLDDQGYDTDAFKKTGYIDTEVKTEFTSVNDYGGYDIIVCDIDGIGMNIDPQRQGLAVAETLKQNYPEKIIVTYSLHNPYSYDSRYIEAVDGHIFGTSSPAEIAKFLDDKARIFFDPVEAWKNYEKSLRREEISNKTIAYLESIYFTSLLKNKNLFTGKSIYVDSDTMKAIRCVINTLEKIVEGFIHA